MRRSVMNASIRQPWIITRLEDLMRCLFRPAPYLAVALVVGACASGPASSPAAVVSAAATPSQVASPDPTAEAASPSPTQAATPSPSPIVFTSTTYGYSLTLPGDWTIIQAKAKWDGKGAPFHDVPEADQFVSKGASSAWFFGAPTKKDLAARVKESIAANAAEHGTTCPPVPEIQDPLDIGGEPGVLLGYNCGILINSAITVHDGVAYLFGFRDPAVHAATSPADREAFLALLQSVKFPD
jgi:hypothetical protein